MADLKEKTYVEDVDRSVYDIRDAENDAYRMESGLTPEIVEKLSTEKDDPVWMQQFRLESLQIYNEMKIPNWGPSIEGLDMDHIATYVRPNTKMRNDWKDVPEDIKETFERLGIPQAERKSLAGVGAQYDSELVYHNVKDSVAAEGVVYTDMGFNIAIKGNHPGNSQEVREFKWNWLGRKCIIIVQYCDGTDADLLGTPCNPMQMSSSFTANKDMTRTEFSFASITKGMDIAIYQGEVPTETPAVSEDS